MDSKTTQGTSRASMIILATVVFPDALPPPRPAEGGSATLGESRRASSPARLQGSPPPSTLPAAPLPRPPGLTARGARGSSHQWQGHLGSTAGPALLTDGKGLLGLCAVLIIPGRPPGRVDGALAGAQQGRLRLALAGGALPG